MTAEIERKFLVLDDRWREHASEGSVLRQAYLVATKNRTVRVRTIDAQTAKLTVKIRSGQGRREEFEYDIPYADAKEMFQYAPGAIEKARFEVEHQGHTWEVDVYSGRHRGLVIAEVELLDHADNPVLPDWLGPEVTGNSRFSNRVLAATHGNPEDTSVAATIDQRRSLRLFAETRNK
ncbi:CYTH domain-containing protein [Ensifer adhaerens]|uniref:CYTH domain-containing protein n=1 Tax=Ensifer adhaerens TaxID=106592 RepID=UPI000CF10B92|nr:CYTH domain-containing protein [Ensifer adhaerens]